VSDNKEVKHIERKTKALTLLLIIASAAAFAAFATTAFGQDANSTTTDTTTSTSTTTTTATPSTTDLPFGGFGMIVGEQGFGRCLGGFGGHGRGFGGFGGMGNIEISSAYNQTITNILGNDSDVQNLISQGFNITSIRPIVKSVIGADGSITTAASTAIVTLQNGTSGHATVTVDITNVKVTQIVTLTRTVIDKSTS
jgi:hypothetical protein